MAQVQIDIRARDQRFLRAAKEVLKRYTIRRQGVADGVVTFAIEGGTKPYIVTVHEDWAVSPSCSCPDAMHHARSHNGGYCKHIIATLLTDEALSYQLLDILL